MTNLRKSFILLSAAITLGNLEQGQAAEKKQAAPAGENQKTAGAKKTGERQPVRKQPRARRRPTDSDFDLGMPSGSAYDVLSRSEL